MDPESLDRFRREMEATGRLQHENLIHPYHVIEQDKVDYLVMEYVDGQDLKTLVEQSGPRPITQACDIVRQPTGVWTTVPNTMPRRSSTSRSPVSSCTCYCNAFGSGISSRHCGKRWGR